MKKFLVICRATIWCAGSVYASTLLDWCRKRKQAAVPAFRVLAVGSVILCWFIPKPAVASSLTFTFDAAYSSALNLGDTSGLPDLSVGLVKGQIIHGSFSYDPSTEPYMTEDSIFGNGTLARFNTGPFSFSIPSLNFSTPTSNAWLFNETAQPSGDSFGVFADIPASSSLPPNSVIDVGFTQSFGNLFNSLTLPQSVSLDDFEIAVFAVSEIAPGAERVLSFEITNVSVVSDTPLPGALPLFATGLGALGLFGLRRKKKAAAFAA